MEILYIIIFFILGTILGTIYTTIGLRLPKNEKLFTKKKCKKCHHPLSMLDSIPLFSYIINRGRCKYCHSKIDILYPYMEFTYNFLIALGAVSLLMTIVVSDLTYLVIPNEVLLIASIYFFIIQVLNIGPLGALKHLFSGIFLFTIMYLIMLIGDKVFKKESLGGGDIKMMFVFGLVLDPLLGTLTIFLGSLLALPMSLYLMKKNNENVIPFGPFLLIAFVFIYFTKITSSGLLNFLGIR